MFLNGINSGLINIYLMCRISFADSRATLILCAVYEPPMRGKSILKSMASTNRIMIPQTVVWILLNYWQIKNYQKFDFAE